ncbi:MAG: B12-binding domain-containing radical SAM protein, partial [Planctomycetota bacterium]
YVYDHNYAGDNLRTRFRNSIKTTKNPRNSMFAFRVGSDWKQVFEQVLQNLKELYDSGDYYKDWYKSNAGTVTKPVMETVST